MFRRNCCFVIFFLLMLPVAAWANNDKKRQKEQEWTTAAENYLRHSIIDSSAPILLPRVKIDTLYKKRGINIYFSEELAYQTLRQTDIERLYDDLHLKLGLRKRKRMHIHVDGLPLEQYVPVYYSRKKDKERINKPYKGIVNVQNTSKPYQVEEGLNQRHIALWNSHGLYYNREMDIWKWQRAPLFTTVEDLYTSAYVLSFLVPMLENAGANVYLPRERDIQTHEVVVDNEDVGFEVKGEVRQQDGIGFRNNVILDSTVINPFTLGTYEVLGQNTEVIWKTIVPENGNYAVYVSYVTSENSCDEAQYKVFHSGGITQFSINQQMGGGTWIYLGNFHFEKDSTAMVVLNGNKKGEVTADAVRFGGGMGSVYRGGKTSNMPRWEEASRYYLQYAGALDSITFNRHGDTIDYNDDFRCRARWVNYLKGGNSIEPWVSNGAEIEGLHIPIDLSIGIHSDAGHFPSMDTTVGTLVIYSTYDVGMNRNFYSCKKEKSRLVNRDFADLVQTQIVSDVRALYDEKWTQREIWDKMYSEATFAQCPSMLLEVLAHSNALDMHYGLDPQFRFDVSRSIYKAMLRFLSTYYKDDYVVQPLPVADMAIINKNDRWQLTWNPVEDELEPTATPKSYVVYSRIDGKGWDNGVPVEENFYEIDVTDTLIRSYKVTAVNAGGESLPSTILSVDYWTDTVPTVLVVDGFTRVSAPFFMESGDSVGIASWLDEGVPWGIDIATIGKQYNYNQNEKWESDDIPGHGGTYNDLAGTVFVGNTFDNAFEHVKSIVNAGYNVVSVSMNAVLDGTIDLSHYDAVDLIFGEQRSTVSPSGEVQFDIYTPQMMQVLGDYLKNDNARLIVTGAHIAGDALADTTAQLLDERQRFVKTNFGFSYGGQMKEDYNALFLLGDTLKYSYNTDYNLEQYRVENADVLVPEDSVRVVFTYLKNEGAVLYNHQPSYKVISSGVPFETIKDSNKRDELMKTWLEYLFSQD